MAIVRKRDSNVIKCLQIRNGRGDLHNMDSQLRGEYATSPPVSAVVVTVFDHASPRWKSHRSCTGSLTADFKGFTVECLLQSFNQLSQRMWDDQ